MKKTFLTIFLFLLIFPSVSFARSFVDKPHIPVLEYHSVGEVEARWTRSYENFKNDLLWLYNNDYYPVTASSFADMSFRIPKGKKPVVITFDDGNKNQFEMLSDGSVNPFSAVGIMDEFCRQYPDFSCVATFYVNSLPFGQKEYVSQKLQHLFDAGSEIGNHTLTHASLSKLSTAGVEVELGGLVKKLTTSTGFSFPVETIAYPHGLLPTDVSAVEFGSYDGHFYRNKIGFLVGAEPSLLPSDENFNPFKVPRIQAIDDEWKRWFGRDPTLITGKTEENFKPYVYGEGKVYPYHLCDDDDAEKFILQKKLKVSFSSLRSFLMSFLKTESPQGYKGIYLNSGLLNENGKKLVEKMIASGGNMVVFDVLPAGRLIPYPGKEGFNAEYTQKVKDFIAYLNEKDVYTIARYVLFKNSTLAIKKPNWLLKSRASGRIWSGDGGPVWLDSSLPEVKRYIIDATKAVAELGVQEIQFDYVRFPTASNSSDTSYYAARTATDHVPQKWEVIRDFLKQARTELAPYGVKIGADLYAIVAWNDGYDAHSTGQKIECLAPYLDVIYPMIYPSHFGPGFAGFPNPADEPYHFVHKTSELFLNYMEGTETVLRPWLQAFAMNVTNYTSAYAPTQVRAINDLGVFGFVLWNASNNYAMHWGAF
jgi:peptidoglycan/xylan/chitin deacetylase (PgdA/CDA1 family)